MEFQIPDFLPAAAELFVAGMALLVLLVVSFMRRGAATAAYWLTQATVVGMAATALLSGRDVGFSFTFGQMYIDDPLGDFLKLWVALSVLMSLLYGRRYLIDRGASRSAQCHSTCGCRTSIKARQLRSPF
jgi:NADH-quinone oxidoreductase subunit N